MTMHEQELMLFGGWAKVQTPPPIETGAYAPSVNYSLSTCEQSGELSISSEEQPGNISLSAEEQVVNPSESAYASNGPLQLQIQRGGTVIQVSDTTVAIGNPVVRKAVSLFNAKIVEIQMNLHKQGEVKEQRLF